MEINKTKSDGESETKTKNRIMTLARGPEKRAVGRTIQLLSHKYNNTRCLRETPVQPEDDAVTELP